MPSYKSKIVLRLPLSDEAALVPFVENCLRDKVVLIAIWGPGASAVEAKIDRIIIGEGSDKSRFIVTTSHEQESFRHALQFAEDWELDDSSTGAVQVVSL
jgi:hypothetical protein